MSTEMNAHVLNLLETYHERERKIALLRYELEHPAHISPEEMLGAMSLRRGDGISSSGGRISDKTLYIALNYQEKVEQANLDVAHEIAGQLVELEQQQKRLNYYITLLDERQVDVIRLIFFERYAQNEVAKKLSIVSRTVRRTKEEAIDKLVEMYSFAENLTESHN